MLEAYKQKDIGALETGVFLVDIPPKVAGYSWKGLPFDTVDGTQNALPAPADQLGLGPAMSNH